MTTSIAALSAPIPHQLVLRQPVPHQPARRQPVLRRLADILPSAPVTGAPPTVTPPTPNATAPNATAPDPTAPDPTVPDPAGAAVVERVLRAAVEIVGGQRQARQLTTVLRPDALAYLESLRLAVKHLEPRLRKVLVFQHADGALDAVALVTLNTGVRALAARFERHASRWRCTALQIRLTTGDLAARRTRQPQTGAPIRRMTA